MDVTKSELEAMAAAYESLYGQPGYDTPVAAMRVALATLPSPTDRAAVVEALKPFAETNIRADIPGDQAVIGYADIVYLTVADFRRAAQLYSALRKE